MAGVVDVLPGQRDRAHTLGRRERLGGSLGWKRQGCGEKRAGEAKRTAAGGHDQA
jgi:hypothetical protein